MLRRVPLLFLLVSTIGCSRPSTPEPTPAEPPPSSLASLPATIASSDGAKIAVRKLLAPPDAALPGLSKFDQLPGAASALRSLSLEDPVARVRVRAIHSLRHYPDPATLRLLVNFAGTPRLRMDLRVAALETIGRLDPSLDPRLVPSVVPHLRSKTESVALAAARALSGKVSARDALAAAATDPAVGASTQAAIRTALEAMPASSSGQ